MDKEDAALIGAIGFMVGMIIATLMIPTRPYQDQVFTYERGISDGIKYGQDQTIDQFKLEIEKLCGVNSSTGKSEEAKGELGGTYITISCVKGDSVPKDTAASGLRVKVYRDVIDYDAAIIAPEPHTSKIFTGGVVMDQDGVVTGPGGNSDDVGGQPEGGHIVDGNF